MFCKAKSAKKNVFRPLSNKNVQILNHFFPLLFPKNSESLKIFDIPLREVGAKRPLNGTSKVNGQTNRQTDRHTGRRTFRLIESMGPEVRCFEKDKFFFLQFVNNKRLKYQPKNKNLKHKKSSCDKTQKLKLWLKYQQNSKSLNRKTQAVTKLKNSNCDKTQTFKLWQNSKTQIVTTLK